MQQRSFQVHTVVPVQQLSTQAVNKVQSSGALQTAPAGNVSGTVVVATPQGASAKVKWNMQMMEVLIEYRCVEYLQ